MGSVLLIRAALPEELPAVLDIESAAGQAFRALGMDAVVDDDLPSIEELRSFLATDGFLVVADDQDRPVAHLLIHPLEGHGHVEQVSVHPDHAGLRLGSQLLDAADRWVAQREFTGLTLTAFARVPWNAPYYQRLGFRILNDAELSVGLRRVRAAEADRGLDRWPRVAMARETGANRPR